MLQYLAVSYLLSLLGMLAYAGYFRQRLGVVQRKHFLLGLVLASFVMPYFSEVPQPWIPVHQADHQAAIDRFTTQLNVVDGSDPALNKCYQEQLKVGGDICLCEMQQKANMVVFTPNRLLENVLWGLRWSQFAFQAGCLFWLVLLGQKFWSLWRFSRQGKKEILEIDGLRIWRLFPEKPFPVSSFALGARYLVWPEALDKLPRQEQEAILLHEIGHLKRRDPLLLLFLHLLQAVWWLNPAFYALRRELLLLAEVLADRYAVDRTGEAKDYARMLLRFKGGADSLPISSAFGGSMTRQRVLFLLHPEAAQPMPRRHASLLAVGGLLWITSVFAMPTLETYGQTLKEYEWLRTEQSLTGKSVFCKSCLLEELRSGPRKPLAPGE